MRPIRFKKGDNIIILIFGEKVEGTVERSVYIGKTLEIIYVRATNPRYSGWYQASSAKKLKNLQLLFDFMR